MDSRFIRRAEFVFWITGFACLGVYLVAQAQSDQAQTDAIAQIEQQGLVSQTQLPDMTHWSKKRIESYDSSDANAQSPLGVLSIPAVDVRVAVFNGTSDRLLDLGAGRIPGTAPTAGDGNLAIAAHRDGFFRGLKDIEVGDELSFTSKQETHTFTVTELSVVDPTDVSVLESTVNPTITLITCYPFYFVGSAPQRFIVRAELPADKSDLPHLAN